MSLLKCEVCDHLVDIDDDPDFYDEKRDMSLCW